MTNLSILVGPLSFLILLYLRYCCSCPTGYSRCALEDHTNPETCNAAGVIAYGTSDRYTYRTSSGSIQCSNNIFGDPLDGTQKECCSQISILTGPVTPIVGTISCGETVYSFFGDVTDNHFWQLTTNNLNDITYTTCESSFDSRVYIYNNKGEIFSVPYCGAPINANDPTKTGDDCNEDECILTNNNELFTIPSQIADTYYIQVISYDNDGSGEYQLSVTCNTKAITFQHLGCYGDDTVRAMSVDKGEDHTLEQCYNACLGYKYFGLEYGSECFCDNNYATATQYGTSTNCGTCTSQSANCMKPGTGGGWAMDLYQRPTPSPTSSPTPAPTNNPTPAPTNNPTRIPTNEPSPAPTMNPTPSPTLNPTPAPTNNPTPAPTNNPTPSPTNEPSPAPTTNPTPSPTTNPSPAPTTNPSPSPTNNPSLSPTPSPTDNPTLSPTPSPTDNPTAAPTNNPTLPPTPSPTSNPSSAPSLNPSESPSWSPSQPPTVSPSYSPSSSPSIAPSYSPSNTPTYSPSNAPSKSPTNVPTKGLIINGRKPTGIPTKTPTKITNTKSNGNIDQSQETKKKEETNGLMDFFGSFTIIIISILITSIICCCCFIIFLFCWKKKQKKRKKPMKNESAEGAEGISSDGTGTTTNIKRNIKPIRIEMPGIPTLSTNDMVRLNSLSSNETPYMTTPQQSPQQTPHFSPFPMGSMPIQQPQTFGAMAMLSTTNNNGINQQQQIMMIPATNQSHGITQGAADDIGDVANNDKDLLEDDDDDDLNEMYEDQGDNDSDNENYGAMYETPGGHNDNHNTAGQ